MNLARKMERKQNVEKKWAIKTQRKGALVLGVTSNGTLAQALEINTKPVNGISLLPLDSVDTLINASKVWVNSKVCMDRERVLKPGDYIAVFPTAEMQLVDDMKAKIRRIVVREVNGL
jgi:hypothetical protein